MRAGVCPTPVVQIRERAPSGPRPPTAPPPTRGPTRRVRNPVGPGIHSTGLLVKVFTKSGRAAFQRQTGACDVGTDRSDRAEHRGRPTPPTPPTSSSSAPARPAAAPPTGWPRAGLDVALLEKTTFPREKVCGDGLTPRGTRALVDMGIDVSEANGWLHNRGLRVIGGGQRLHLDWPELTSFPPFGLVRPRADLDAMLANQAVKAGARLLRADQRHRADPRRRRPGRRRQRPTHRRGQAAGQLPRPARAHLRGRVGQARPAPGRAPQRQAPARRGRPPLLHQPARPTTTTSSPGWSSGTASPTSPTCCPATAGSSAWATARSTPGSAC